MDFHKLRNVLHQRIIQRQKPAIAQLHDGDAGKSLRNRSPMIGRIFIHGLRLALPPVVVIQNDRAITNQHKTTAHNSVPLQSGFVERTNGIIGDRSFDLRSGAKRKSKRSDKSNHWNDGILIQWQHLWLELRVLHILKRYETFNFSTATSPGHSSDASSALRSFGPPGAPASARSTTLPDGQHRQSASAPDHTSVPLPAGSSSPGPALQNACQKT